MRSRSGTIARRSITRRRTIGLRCGAWSASRSWATGRGSFSGLHFCFDAPTRKSVDAFYKAALGAGGKDNGKPGLRADYGDNYYAAFVIDPDGYRLEAYCAK